MWLLGPFLIIYAMIRLWKLTLTLFLVGVTWLLIAQHPIFGYCLLGLEVVTLIFALRVREQDGNARAATNLQRRVEADLDRRDRRLEVDLAGRAHMERQAELIAKALIQEARAGPMSDEPTICRMVHYVSYGTPGGEFDSVCRAAMVTEVFSDQHVQLTVFNPTGIFMHESRHSGRRPPMVGGSWHWPRDCPAIS